MSVVHDTSTDLKLAIFVLQPKCLLMSDLSPITIPPPPLLPSQLFPIPHLFSVTQAFNTSFLSQRDLNSDHALSTAFTSFQFASKGKLYASRFFQKKIDVWNPFHFDSVKFQLLVFKFFTNHIFTSSIPAQEDVWSDSVLQNLSFMTSPSSTVPLKHMLGNSDMWAQRHFTIILVLTTANFTPVAHILPFFFLIHFWDPWLLPVSQSIMTMAIQELQSCCQTWTAETLCFSATLSIIIKNKLIPSKTRLLGLNQMYMFFGKGCVK